MCISLINKTLSLSRSLSLSLYIYIYVCVCVCVCMCVCVCVCVLVVLEAPVTNSQFLVLYHISPKTDTLSQKLLLPTFVGLHQSFSTSRAGQWCIPNHRPTAFLRVTVCLFSSLILWNTSGISTVRFTTGNCKNTPSGLRHITLIVVSVTAVVFHVVFSYLAIRLHYLLVNFE